MKKYLGIDYGTKKVGVAVSDDAGEFAFPKDIFDRVSALKEIIAICGAEKVVGIVVGESVATNEEKNTLVSVTQNFAEQLKTETSLPVYFEREDFSSVEAHRHQTKAGNRDDSAAAIILQRFLDKKKRV